MESDNRTPSNFVVRIPNEYTPIIEKQSNTTELLVLAVFHKLFEESIKMKIFGKKQVWEVLNYVLS